MIQGQTKCIGYHHHHRRRRPVCAAALHLRSRTHCALRFLCCTSRASALTLAIFDLFLRNCAVLQSRSTRLALLALQEQAHSRSSPVPCTLRCPCDLARRVFMCHDYTVHFLCCGTSCAVDRLPLAMMKHAGRTTSFESSAPLHRRDKCIIEASS